jgi:glycerate dehydrogenase
MPWRSPVAERRPRIVVLDGFTLNPGDNPWDELAALGELVVHDRTDPEHVLERAAGAVILLTNKTPVSAATIRGLPGLRYISVLATGYNVVDVEAARGAGVAVSNVPEYGTDSVAQFVFALLLELASRVGQHERAVKDGVWTASPDFCFWEGPLVELSGKTLGIVGFGRIGQRVGRIANAMGMRVLAFDPSPRFAPDYEPFAWAADVEELFRSADAVSLNCALTPQNLHFVNARILSLMKPGAFLVNAARGGLVEEADLAEALNAGRLAGAALDVVSAEPISTDNPLLGARNCIITPHIAWASAEARRRLMRTTAENVRSFLSGKPQNVVN